MACLRHSVVLARGCEVWNGEARSACDVGQGGPTLRLRGIGCPRLRFGLGLGDKGGADDPAGGRFLVRSGAARPGSAWGARLPGTTSLATLVRPPGGNSSLSGGNVGMWEGGKVAVAGSGSEGRGSRCACERWLARSGAARPGSAWGARLPGTTSLATLVRPPGGRIMRSFTPMRSFTSAGAWPALPRRRLRLVPWPGRRGRSAGAA